MARALGGKLVGAVESRLVTVREIAEMTGLSESFIRERCRGGRRKQDDVLPHVRIGARLFFEPIVILDYIAAHRVGTTVDGVAPTQKGVPQ